MSEPERSSLGKAREAVRSSAITAIAWGVISIAESLAAIRLDVHAIRKDVHRG